MRISREAQREVERAFETYKRVVEDAREDSRVSDATVRYYSESVD